MLLDKQKIILKCNHDGQSQRAIHRETDISRKTIRKYIREYESKKVALLEAQDIPNGELIQRGYTRGQSPCAASGDGILYNVHLHIRQLRLQFPVDQLRPGIKKITVILWGEPVPFNKLRWNEVGF